MDKEEFVENLIEITQDCLIVKTQAGFKKLLKKLNIHFRENDNRCYSYNVVQLTKDKHAFRTVKYCNNIYLDPVKYPIKYPCIISVYDKKFELGHYTLCIRYFDNELCKELKQILK